MTFEELIALLQGGEAPETIYDDLTSSYNGMVEGGTAALATVKAELEAANAKLLAVMAHNYELLTAVPATGNPADPAPSGDEDDTDNEDLATFDDLISYS